MKIFYIAAVDLNSKTGDAIHVDENCKYISQNNNEITLLSFTESKNNSFSYFYKLIKIPRIKIRGGLQITWNFFGLLKGVTHFAKNKPDVIYTRNDPWLVVAPLLSFLFRTPYCVELNGIITEDYSLAHPNSKMGTKSVEFFEKLHFHFAKIITGSPGYIKYYSSKYNEYALKMHSVTLGYNDNIYTAPKEFNCDQSITRFVWIGNMAKWQGLIYIIEAASLLLKTGYKFQIDIIGDGIEHESIKRTALVLGLENNIFFHGYKNEEYVADILKVSDVGLCAFPIGRGDLGTISALKTITYMGSGLAIITTDMDEYASIINEIGAGFSSYPSDPHSYYTKMKEMCNLKIDNKLNRLKYNSFKYANENLTWGKTSSKLELIIKRAIKNV